MNSSKYMETTTSPPFLMKLLQFFLTKRKEEKKILRIWLDVYFKTYGRERYCKMKKRQKRKGEQFGELRILWEDFSIVTISSPYWFVALHWENDNNKKQKRKINQLIKSQLYLSDSLGTWQSTSFLYCQILPLSHHWFINTLFPLF